MGTHQAHGLALVRRALAVATVTVTAGMFVAAAGPAGAAPQPTVSQVQRKLSRLTSEMDRVVQHYDEVKSELSSARQRVTMVSHEVGKDHVQFHAMQDQIAQIAALAYEDGSMTSVAALLTSGSPQTVLSQAAILTHLSTDQYEQLHQVILMARQLSGAQQSLKRTEAAVAKLKRQVASQKSSLAKLIAKEKSILATLTAQQAAAAASAQIGGGGTVGGSYTGTTSTQAGKAVAFAYMVLNDHTPYVYGGTGPPGPNGGYDCSGLAQAAWAAAGVSIPRTTYGQWAALPHIPMSDIQPGDLIFFDAEGHVAIYVGGGMVIDAPQPGMYVEKVSLSSPWYAANLDGAARP